MCNLKVGISLLTQTPNCAFKIGVIYCMCTWASAEEGAVVFSLSGTDVTGER